MMFKNSNNDNTNDDEHHNNSMITPEDLSKARRAGARAPLEPGHRRWN